MIDTFSEEIKGKVTAFEKKVEENFHFLKAFDYESSDIEFTEDKTFYKFWVTVNFKSDHREISILYFPFDENGQNDYDSITISISKVPWDDAYNDFLDFDRYLKSKKSDYDPEKFNTNNYQGSFEERIGKVLDLYKSLLRDYALDIIKGDHWEKGHFQEW